MIPSIRTYCKKEKKKKKENKKMKKIPIKEDYWTRKRARKCISPIYKQALIKMEDGIYEIGTNDIDPLRLSPVLNNFSQEFVVKEEPLDL